MDKRNIIFCGGGTGGHYYPLMAIKNELEKKMENNNLYYILSESINKILEQKKLSFILGCKVFENFLLISLN